MLPWKWKKNAKQPQDFVALSTTMEGITFAYGATLSPLPQCHSYEFLACSPAEQEEALAIAMGQHSLVGKPCHYILSPHDYRLLFLDAPNVPDAEVAAAAQWLVKDLIDLPIEETSIAVFPVPVRPGQTPKIYVIVCTKKRLQEIARLIKLVGLKLTAISIYDLMWRNILALYPNVQQGIALLCLEQDYTNLLIVRDDLLCLTRPLDVSNTSNIANLVLEIQRSLDYYQSQSGQTRPAKLVLAPTIDTNSKLAEELSQDFGLVVEILDVNNIIKFPAPLNSKLQAECISVVGALMPAPQPEEQSTSEARS